MKSTSPNRETYSITRRWMPWRRRVKGGDTGGGDLGGWGGDLGGLGDDPISMILGIILLAVVAVLVLPAVLLAIGAALEVALLLALLPLAVLGRTLLGRPWEIEVRATGTSDIVWPVVHTEPVKGWSASGVRIAEIAEEIRLGRFTPGLPVREQR